MSADDEFESDIFDTVDFDASPLDEGDDICCPPIATVDDSALFSNDTLVIKENISVRLFFITDEKRVKLVMKKKFLLYFEVSIHKNIFQCILHKVKQNLLKNG